MLRKKVKLLLKHLQVCIFAEIVFGVRCTLRTFFLVQIQAFWDLQQTIPWFDSKSGQTFGQTTAITLVVHQSKLFSD